MSGYAFMHGQTGLVSQSTNKMGDEARLAAERSNETHLPDVKIYSSGAGASRKKRRVAFHKIPSPEEPTVQAPGATRIHTTGQCTKPKQHVRADALSR